MTWTCAHCGRFLHRGEHVAVAQTESKLFRPWCLQCFGESIAECTELMLLSPTLSAKMIENGTGEEGQVPTSGQKRVH